MSQIVFDAIQALRGELEATIANLRVELADQKAIVDRLTDLASKLQGELKRMQASQDLVGSIISPYGSKGGDQSKVDHERSRTVRAVMNNEMSRRIVELRAEGDDSHPLMEIHRDGLKAWGTWQNYWSAVKAALEAASTPKGARK